MESTLLNKHFGSAVVTSLIIGTLCFWTAVAPNAYAGARRAEQQLKPSVLLAGHSDGIHAAAFLPDGKRLVSASHDGTVKLWSIETGECLHTFAGHEKAVRAVAVASDGKRIASASQD